MNFIHKTSEVDIRQIGRNKLFCIGCKAPIISRKSGQLRAQTLFNAKQYQQYYTFYQREQSLICCNCINRYRNLKAIENRSRWFKATIDVLKRRKFSDLAIDRILCYSTKLHELEN